MIDVRTKAKKQVVKRSLVEDGYGPTALEASHRAWTRHRSAGVLALALVLSTSGIARAGTTVFDRELLTLDYAVLGIASLVDIDTDGDLDVFAQGGIAHFFENVGSATEPVLAPGLPAPFGLPVGSGALLRRHRRRRGS
jgi:hypothetical protein